MKMMKANNNDQKVMELGAKIMKLLLKDGT